MPERPTTCKSGAPTQDGSRSSSLLSSQRLRKLKQLRAPPRVLNRSDNLLISETIRSLMFQEEKMPKAKLLLFGVTMVRSTSNGKYNMLTKQNQFKTKDLWKTLDSIATDHSTFNQECQSIELLNATVLTTFGSEDIERTLLLSNSSSTVPQRPSDLNNGRTTPWKSNPTVDQPT
jgi:hypothetical protein